jgi:hypothetical protein
MADTFATPSDLAALLQADIDTATATLLLEGAASLVQEAAGGQRITLVVDDSTGPLIGSTDSFFQLPQIPVVSVSAVDVDGTAVAAGTEGYKLIGNRLWRRSGWQANYGWSANYGWHGHDYGPSVHYRSQDPSLVTVTYTHGLAPGDWRLQLARQASLMLAATPYGNPGGVVRLQIDDYQAQYEAMAARMEAAETLRARLRKQYGHRAGLVRLG